jgi:hypothetical protein
MPSKSACYRHHAGGINDLARGKLRGFLFYVQVRRDVPHGFNRAHAVGHLHDFVQIETMPFSPILPMAHDATRRVNEHPVQVEQHRVTFQLAFILVHCFPWPSDRNHSTAALP